MTKTVQIRILDNRDYYFFNLHGHDIRALEIDGQQWYLAKDVCDILGITSRTAYRKLDDDQRRSLDRTAMGLNPGKPMTLVSESGLYKLIFRSDKLIARDFQDWVCREVLPSLRKTGKYELGQEFAAKDITDENEFVWLAMTVTRGLDRVVGKAIEAASLSGS